jgi:hypothetical protein
MRVTESDHSVSKDDVTAVLCRTVPYRAVPCRNLCRRICPHTVLAVVHGLCTRPGRNLILDTEITACKMVSNNVRECLRRIVLGARCITLLGSPHPTMFTVSAFLFVPSHGSPTLSHLVSDTRTAYSRNWRSSTVFLFIPAALSPNLNTVLLSLTAILEGGLYRLFIPWTWISMLWNEGPHRRGSAAYMAWCRVGLVVHGRRPRPCHR